MADGYTPLSEEERKAYLNRLAASLGIRTSGGYYFDPGSQLFDPYISEYTSYGEEPDRTVLEAEYAPNYTYAVNVAQSGGRTLDATLAQYIFENPDATPGELQGVVDSLFMEVQLTNPDGTVSTVIPAEDYFNLDQDQKYVAYDAAKSLFNEYNSGKRKADEDLQKWNEDAPWNKLGLPAPNAEYDLMKYEPYKKKREEYQVKFRETYGSQLNETELADAEKFYFDSLDKKINQRLRESGRSPFYDAIITREALKYATP